MTDGPTVVKLGGSHAFSSHLPRWIAALEAVAGPIVVVPGGGPFADAVRTAQPLIGFSDAAAHVMAMLAMEQYGHALASLGTRMNVVTSLAALRRSLALSRIPVWSPAAMTLRDKTLAHSWEVTSDSLALWLARKLKAPRLLLVKQILPKPGRAAAAQLAADGIVDGAFPSLYGNGGLSAWISRPEGYTCLREFVSGAPGVMVRIDG